MLLPFALNLFDLLRLWLVVRPPEMAEDPPQQLAYMNVVPKVSKPETGTGYPEFEGLDQTFQNFNEWMLKYPLPGKNEISSDKFIH